MSYSLEYLNAATVYALGSNTTEIPSLFPPMVDATQFVTASFSEQSVQLQPGASSSVTITFHPIDNVDVSLLPVYSGYLTINSTATLDGGPLQIPVLGVATNMTTQQLFDKAEGFPIFRSFNPADNRTITMDDATFTLNATTSDLPAIVVRLLLPTRVLRVDVLPPNDSNSNATVFAGLKTLGYLLQVTSDTIGVSRAPQLIAVYSGILLDLRRQMPLAGMVPFHPGMLPPTVNIACASEPSRYLQIIWI